MILEIGGKPILWHIMKTYSTHGLTDSIILCGYKGHMIKEYFTNYLLYNADVSLDLGTGDFNILNHSAEPWRITMLSTGELIQTGGRLEFFSEATARALRQERAAQGQGHDGGADLIAGNNVYAHVPDINDFTRALQAQADHAADSLLDFLTGCKSRGETVAAYGAAAKGTTLLNYARVSARLLPYVCDAAPFKQGRFLPGSHIPVRPVETLRENPPQHLLILPWNIKEEIAADLAWLARDHGTRFWTVMPEPTQLEPSAATQAA